MAYNFSTFKQGLKGLEDWLKKELATIRTSRATPAVLDGVFVEAYGAKTPLNQVATITSEDARNLRIIPWDTTLVKATEKAITDSKLGLSVNIDDKGIRVSFPELTTERRDSLVKLSKQKLEDARVSLRLEREKVWEDIQKKEKEGGMGEDEKFRLKAEMQKLVDETNKQFDEALSRKEKEILS
jgi:ribosome recycling factor